MIYTVSVGTAVQVALAFVLFLFGHLRLYHDWGVPVAPSCFYIITKTTNIQINSLSVQVYIKAFISAALGRDVDEIISAEDVGECGAVGMKESNLD